MDSYAKAFHFRAEEQKSSQIWRNTHLSHIAHIPAAQTPQRLSLRHICLYVQTSMQTHAHILCTLLSS